MADLSSLYKKTGGFMKGICHPSSDREGLLEAGLTWVRRDIPYPYDSEGNETPSFKSYRECCEYHAEKGIYTVGITPYPSAFIAAGIDVRTKEGLDLAAEVCAKMAKALKASVRCWQITNEMHVPHFRAPLTTAQSAEFVIACAKGIRNGDPDGCVGHNSCNGEWREKYCRYIEESIGGSDYIGLDCYAGTWGDGNVDTYSREIDLFYEALGIPVILMEFGYSSLGRYVPDTAPEIQKYFEDHGFSGREDAVARLDEFVRTLPEGLQRNVEHCAEEDKADYALGSFQHVLKYWNHDGGIGHTEEGQAEFYRQLLPKLLAHPHLGGAILYCWKDSQTCFTCGQDDCPCETAWGICRLDESRKPAYYAVKEAFAAL